MRPLVSYRLLAGTVFLTLWTLSCDSTDLVDPETRADGIFTLTTPDTPVTGALVELTGVADVILSDGEAISRRLGERLRVVLLLDEAGTLDFGIRLTSHDVVPTGSVLAVIGGNDQMLTPLTDFGLKFDR